MGLPTSQEDPGELKMRFLPYLAGYDIFYCTRILTLLFRYMAEMVYPDITPETDSIKVFCSRKWEELQKENSLDKID